MINKKIKLLLIITLVFVFSCSTNNVGADNDFLAYYNTFYSAETSFDKAEEIIDNSPLDIEISKSTIDLLDIAIENSNIILDKYYNTQYIDDAYYIIARSSIYKEQLTVAKYYFEKIVRDYPESDFFYESYIWLGFIELDFGNYDNLDSVMLYLNDNLDKVEKISLYYLFMAKYYEAFKYDKSAIQEQYLLAIDSENQSSKKIKIYLELINIEDSNKNYYKVIEYIGYLNELSDFDLDTDLLNKWFQCNRMLKNYDAIYSEIDDIILTEKLTDKERLFYYSQLLNTMIMDNQYLSAEKIINELVIEFENNRVFKLELCEFYHYLGIIYMDSYNDYANAKTYFDLSVQSTTSKTNKLRAKSELLSESITEYTSLYEEWIYLKDNPSDIDLDGINTEASANNPFFIPMPENYSIYNSSDSLLYKMSEIAYFSFNNKDTTINKLLKIIEEHPESNLSAKSIYFLSQIDSSFNWNQELILKYPDSIYVNNNELENNEIVELRDSAWTILNTSYVESIKLFEQLFEEYSDPISLYSIAFIYEKYAKDIFKSIEYYNLFIDSFPDHYLHVESQISIDKIYSNLQEEIDFINQKLSYCSALGMVKLDTIYTDSIMLVIDEATNSKNINIKDKSYELIEKISEYTESLEYYNNYINNESSEDQINRTNLDRRIYDMLRIFIVDFNNNTKTEKYYLDVIQNISNNNYIGEIYARLYINSPHYVWDSLLYSLDLDSMIINEIFEEIENEKSFNIDCDLDKLLTNKIRYNNMNNTLFPELQDIQENDSTNVNLNE